MSASLRENEGDIMASSRADLEQRVMDLEAEVSNLKRKFAELALGNNFECNPTA